jgi:hypothetical protein
MTDWMAALSHDKYAVMAIFGACTVLSVGGLELFRIWLGRAPHTERGGQGERLAALLIAVAFVPLIAGAIDMAASGRNFLNLSFVLFGAADIFIVAILTLSYRRGLPLGDTDEERRRIAAHDL